MEMIVKMQNNLNYLKETTVELRLNAWFKLGVQGATENEGSLNSPNLLDIPDMNTGRKLQQEYNARNRTIKEVTEVNLTNLVLEMIDREKEEREKELREKELREILSCVMREIVSEEYDDYDMNTTLLHSHDIRTWVTVFENAKDQEQRKQACMVLKLIIMRAMELIF